MNSNSGELKVFAGRTARPLTEKICDHIGIPVGEARTEAFPDGELLVRIEEDVRGRDCFVVSSTCYPVNDNLMELLIFCDCLKRASARRITLVLPYYGYARQDRKSEGRTPITAKLVANLMTAARADRVLAVDLHAAQIQGFFDLPVDHLTCNGIFLQHFMAVREQLGELVLVSPDVGNVKVASSYAGQLDAELAFIHKKRVTGDLVETGTLVGDVEGKTVLMVDDMISTAGTVVEAGALVRRLGAERVVVAATHAVLAGRAMERLSSSEIDEIVVTNTIPPGNRYMPIRDRIRVLCVSKLLADAIDHIHHDKSVSALFRQYADSKR